MRPKLPPPFLPAMLLAAVLGVGLTAQAGLYDATVLADNPRIYFRLDETSGTTATNLGSGGLSLNGVYQNGVTLGVPGIPIGTATGDTAAGFAVAHAQRVVANDGFQPTAYTIEAWVNADIVGGTTGRGLIVRTAGDPNTTWSHELRITSTGRFEEYIYDGSMRSVVGTTVAQPGKWYHVVGTAQNDGPMALYVNGVLEAATWGWDIRSLWNGGTQWMFGSQSGDGVGGGPFTFLQGRLDEVAIYSTVLTAAQIRAHFDAGSAPEPATLTLLARRQSRPRAVAKLR